MESRTVFRNPRLAHSLQAWLTIVGVFAVAAIGCGRHDRHPIVVVAIEELATNERAAEALGGPITRTTPATGSASDTDGIAALQFDVKGPKGAGVVVVEGKRVGGEWGVTSLEVRMPGKSDHLVLTGDLEARTGSDTPKFDPTAEKPASSPTPPPPTEIDIALPPGPPGQK
jgi:hypothetical protein